MAQPFSIHKSIYQVCLSVCFSLSGCALVPNLGKNPSGESLKALEQLPNYGKSGFRNLEPDSAKTKIITALRSMSSRPENVSPFRVLPVVKTDLRHNKPQQPTVTWFGHSSFLLATPSINLLADPIFSNHAGPVPGMVKAFETTFQYQVEHMPVIDVLIISHDHYDHLDYRTVKALMPKVKMVVVPKGIGAHFIHWGYNPKIIRELNWHESIQVDAHTRITLTPSRHTSGRTLKRDKTLWGSFVIQAGDRRFFYSGDGGYGRHFAAIGSQYGPFDITLMECGQYSENWPEHHMFPEQTARAAKELKSKMIIPVHWGKFAESGHLWNESVKRLIPAADSLGIPVCIPKLGQSYTWGTPVRFDGWWLKQ
jgi:L-ascorbate metabolism protein UlaG (beta-lactamase superfamily)